MHISCNEVIWLEVAFSQSEEGTFSRLNSCYINFETSRGDVSVLPQGSVSFRVKSGNLTSCFKLEN